MAQISIIRTNAQLLELQNLPGLIRSIRLVMLGNLASAPAMYQHLHPLVRARLWTCQKLKVLEGFSWLAGWLERLRGVLEDLQPANNPNAALQGPQSVLHAIARIKYEARQLNRAKTEIGYRAGELAAQVENLSTVLYDLSDQVQSGGITVAQFQARIPACLVMINHLLLAGMQF